MTILHHLANPRTIAELRTLTGLTHPELTAELRRLGKRVKTIHPTTVDSRAIRYQRTDEPLPARDPARPPQRAERHDPDRSADPQTLPVDLARHGSGGDVAPDRDDGGRQDDRPAEARNGAGCEWEGRLRRTLGPFEVDRETIPLGLAICRALEGDAYLTPDQIATLVAEMRGPTKVETIRNELAQLRARRIVRRVPYTLSLITGRKSTRWALASRGQTWKGGVKVATRKRAILAALANGPATVPMLSDIVAGLHRARANAIMAELANAGKVTRAGFDHIRDTAGRRRRVIVWALGPV